MNKVIISLFAGILVASAVTTYARTMQANISSSVMRLHVVANSDSDADQEVKLMVRDAITEKFGTDLIETGSVEGARLYVQNNMGEIEDIAQKVLVEKGFYYGVKASIGVEHFPTKHYENITLPAGNYEALKVVLGDGEGQNWWCVMYPPLCFNVCMEGSADEKSMETLSDALGDEEYEIVSESEKIPVKFKFKLLEIFDAITNR